MPCLLFDGKSLVKTVNFKSPNYIGDPINAVKIFNDKEVDELVLLDIKATLESRRPNFEKIAEIASECFMPFAYGGGVRTIEDFKKLFSLGVEKVIVNSALFDSPEVVKEAIAIYGSQSVMASVDVKKSLLGKKNVFSFSKRKNKLGIREFVDYVQNEIKVGELLLTSVDKEGTWDGFDKELVEEVMNYSEVPIISNGGASSKEDLKNILYDVNCNAAAIGSMAVYQKKGMGVLINFPARNEIIIE